MYLVFNIQAGDTFQEAMDYLVSRNLTFAVTDDLGKLHRQSVPRKDIESQTELTYVPKGRSYVKDQKAPRKRKRAPPKPRINLEPININGNASDAQIEQLVATIRQACPEEKTDDLGQEEVGAEKKDHETDSESIECLPEGSSDGEEDSRFNFQSPKNYRTRRGVCQLCHQTISIVSLNPKYHVLSHLGLKEWKCAICDSIHRRPNAAQEHFRKKHPELRFQPFVSNLSDEDKQKVDATLARCFPQLRHRHQKIVLKFEKS